MLQPSPATQLLCRNSKTAPSTLQPQQQPTTAQLTNSSSLTATQHCLNHSTTTLDNCRNLQQQDHQPLLLPQLQSVHQAADAVSSQHCTPSLLTAACTAHSTTASHSLPIHTATAIHSLTKPAATAMYCLFQQPLIQQLHTLHSAPALPHLLQQQHPIKHCYCSPHQPTLKYYSS